ncbi:MAG TPA: hypothetical protein VMU09_03895, partial [Acidimicrobiales bacterium]|nr:hypothetical protein [Acidimicrobiales bacterium]
DILDNAFARYKVLWAVGLFTAGLTAYYMSRLTSLAFFGRDRWREAHPEPDLADADAAAGGAPAYHAQHHGGEVAEPHESPWVMTTPLVVLSVLAFFGGLLLLPGNPFSWNPLAWVAPVFGATLYDAHLSASTQWVLAIVDATVAVLGIALAMRLWLPRTEIPALEPVMLRRSYFIDDVYDRLIGRPGAALSRFSSAVIDAKVIDGAVNGAARLARGTGSGLRRVQTGFVRQYAIGIAIGLVALLAYMATRAWS